MQHSMKLVLALILLRHQLALANKLLAAAVITSVCHLANSICMQLTCKHPLSRTSTPVLLLLLSTPLLPTPLLLQSYSRDLFAFLFVCLTAVAVGSSLQPVRTPLLLNRPQTEEWKGWMQVLFLLYHYFEAREMYNAIRIFIAGYVWMTGYGNFSYYYRTGDFSIGRWVQGAAAAAAAVATDSSRRRDLAFLASCC